MSMTRRSILRRVAGGVVLAGDVLAQKHPGRPTVQPPGTPWPRPELRFDAEIALESASPSAAETGRRARGGRFVQTGWTAVQKRDLLLLELKQGFPSDHAGAVELEMTNLDFDAQVNGKKQHFFNLYASPVGCNNTVPSNFITLRGGDYKDNDGHRGIKVLWRAGGEGDEKAPYAARPKWDPSKTYNWRVEWTATELCVFLDGARIFGPAEFAGRDPAAPLKYVFLSTNGSELRTHFGFPGPVYTKIRLFRS